MSTKIRQFAIDFFLCNVAGVFAMAWLIPVCSISGLRGVTLDSSNKTFDKGTSHHIQQRNTNFAGKHNEFRILAPSSEFISLHSSRNGSWHQFVGGAMLSRCPGPIVCINLIIDTIIIVLIGPMGKCSYCERKELNTK